MALGPLMLGLDGPELTAEERELLLHPQVGGVILFSRNYRSPEQLAALTAAIHDLRQPKLLIGVDHEGGRVQRFRDGFTRLPALRRLGELYDRERLRAKQLARASGWLMATELRAVGVDLSFAPVLDLDSGRNTVIGDRALHNDPEIVADLAHAYMSGMQKAGMEAVGKHFPGHGGVSADSHHQLPYDRRCYADLAQTDMLAFERMIHYGVAGIMPAHIVFPAIDARPASQSPVWLKQILRKRLGFQGAIFSDDLDMTAAAAGGGPLQRAQAALAAGCDMILACNDRSAALAMMRGLEHQPDPVALARLIRFHGRGHRNLAGLHCDADWQRAVQMVREYDAFPLLDMDI